MKLAVDPLEKMYKILAMDNVVDAKLDDGLVDLSSVLASQECVGELSGKWVVTWRWMPELSGSNYWLSGGSWGWETGRQRQLHPHSVSPQTTNRSLWKRQGSEQKSITFAIKFIFMECSVSVMAKSGLQWNILFRWRGKKYVLSWRVYSIIGAQSAQLRISVHNLPRRTLFLVD